MVLNITCLILVNCVIKVIESFECMSYQVTDVKTNKLIFIGHRQGNVYVVYLDDLSSSNVCLMAKKEYESWMWHKKLDHASMHVI